MGISFIQSEGDLEVLVLHETHSALAELIGPDLYDIHGIPPHQSVLFRTKSTFDLFLILVVELIARGNQAAFIGKQFQNLSLLDGLARFCSSHPTESSDSGLGLAAQNLRRWVDETFILKFWCPDVGQDVALSLSRGELIKFTANASKHHLLRLSNLAEALEKMCLKAGYAFLPQELAAVLRYMIDAGRDEMLRASTPLLNLLGSLFLGLNTTIVGRYNQSPTNYVTKMIHPAGVTSDVFRNMYGDVLVFKQYSEERIRNYTPITQTIQNI